MTTITAGRGDGPAVAATLPVKPSTWSGGVPSRLHKRLHNGRQIAPAHAEIATLRNVIAVFGKTLAELALGQVGAPPQLSQAFANINSLSVPIEAFMDLLCASGGARGTRLGGALRGRVLRKAHHVVESRELHEKGELDGLEHRSAGLVQSNREQSKLTIRAGQLSRQMSEPTLHTLHTGGNAGREQFSEHYSVFVNSTNLNHGGVRAAIVDLDGTMVDTLGDFNVALNRMARDLQLRAVQAGAIESFVGKGTEHLVRCVLAHIDAPAAVYDDALRSYLGHYEEVNGQYAQVYPGVTQGLAGLRSAGLRLVCVTNKPTGFARPLLQAKGLGQFFDAVFGGDAFERKKPDPLPLLKACEALGIAPQRTLAIGDSSNDAQAARAAGCPVVLVSYGYNHGQPIRSIPADAYVDSIADVPGWLASAR